MAEQVTNAASDALRVVSVLHQLTLESSLSESRKELIFRILNRSIALARYDRATLWQMDGQRPVFLGVSGQSRVDKNSELVAEWKELVTPLAGRDKAAVLSEEDFGDAPEIYTKVVDRTVGASLLWLPIMSRKKLAAGILLERWGRRTWNEADVKLLHTLALAYGGAWEKFDKARPFRDRARLFAARNKILLGILLLLALGLFHRIPLRVVAPCEVLPRDPLVVTAPLDGVVAEAVVTPGEFVESEDLLFIYDKRVAQEELEVARKQVEIIRSSLNRAQMQAFADPNARAEIALLQHRMEQEQARLDLAEYNVSKLEVRAEREGQVVIDDPHEWRGRPVQVGERVLMIVDPESTKIRMWLPDDDNVVFDFDRPVKIFLNAFPERSKQARLEYVAQSVTVSPDGVPSVMADAEWTTTQKDLKIGLQGTAVLYGEQVTLAYWIIRKPWAWLNKVLGIR